MTFRNHRNRIKAYRVSGKMFGQAFNPSGKTEADIEREEAQSRPNLIQVQADYNDRLRAEAGESVVSAGLPRCCKCGTWTNGFYCSQKCAVSPESEASNE